jgi:hypothetical protein
MRAVVTQVVTKRLGALPVVAEFLHRLRVAEIVDGLCPARDLALATHGEVIEALIADRLTSPRPLVRVRVRVQDWAWTWAVKEVMGLDPDLLDDDRLGRALDAVAPRLEEITGSIAAQAICEFGIDTATLHWDMTSMSLTGACEPDVQDPAYPQVAYGHPKDRRVDLSSRSRPGSGSVPTAPSRCRPRRSPAGPARSRRSSPRHSGSRLPPASSAS